MAENHQKAKILIIDDSDSDRRIYRRYLSGEPGKFEVEEASSVKAGLEAIQRFHPHCIILDYRLPDGSGLELLARIREIANVPVVFVSGNPEPSVMTDAFRTGAFTYLSKDLLHRESLLETIHKALNQG